MTTPADRALGLLGFTDIDPESDELVRALVTAWMSELIRSGIVAHGDEDLRPWEAITDPATAPIWGIAHAALYTGGRMPFRRVTETDAAFLERARIEVVFPRGMRRGSAKAIRDAAASTLTDSKTVNFRERYLANPNRVAISTLTAETPDPAATEAAIRAALPAGILLDFIVIAGLDWGGVLAVGTWGQVNTTYTSWERLRLDLPG